MRGNLFGSLINIARNTAPTMLVGLGMTLVIATRGVDLSVGAVAAISGAAATMFLQGTGDPNRVVNVLVAVGIALGLAIVCGVWNGFLVTVVGIQPIIATLVLMTAGRGVAQLITDEQIITIRSQPYKMIGGGYWLGLPFSIILASTIFALAALLVRRTALGVLLESVGVESGSISVGGRSVALDHMDRLHHVRSPRRSGWIDDHVQRHCGRPQRHGAVPRDRRDSRCRDRRHLARRWPILVVGNTGRRLHHPDDDDDDPDPWDRSGDHVGVQGRHRHAGLSHPVERGRGRWRLGWCCDEDLTTRRPLCHQNRWVTMATSPIATVDTADLVSVASDVTGEA